MRPGVPWPALNAARTQTGSRRVEQEVAEECSARLPERFGLALCRLT